MKEDSRKELRGWSQGKKKQEKKKQWTGGGSNAGLFASHVIMQSEHSTTELRAQLLGIGPP